LELKTIGIYFGHDKEECEKLNWENKIEKWIIYYFFGQKET
jgi:hypothetical protein